MTASELDLLEKKKAMVRVRVKVRVRVGEREREFFLSLLLRSNFVSCEPLSRWSHADTAARWAAIWSVLADQEEDNLEVIKVNPRKCIPERIVEQAVELAETSGEAGFSWSRTNDTTSTASSASQSLLVKLSPVGS